MFLYSSHFIILTKQNLMKFKIRDSLPNKIALAQLNLGKKIQE